MSKFDQNAMTSPRPSSNEATKDTPKYDDSSNIQRSYSSASSHTLTEYPEKTVEKKKKSKSLKRFLDFSGTEQLKQKIDPSTKQKDISQDPGYQHYKNSQTARDRGLLYGYESFGGGFSQS